MQDMQVRPLNEFFTLYHCSAKMDLSGKKKNSPKSSGWSAVLYSDGYNLYYLGGYIYIYYMGMGQNPGT